MNTADRIEASGLKDAEIARLSGLHLATVNRYRKGELQPREAEHIKRLAEALGCRPADLRPDLAAVFCDKTKARPKRAG